MIAPADFCRPAADTDIAIATDTDHFAFVEGNCRDDSLVPGADPYIAQLLAEHQAELLAQAPSRTVSFSRPAFESRRSGLEVAVA